MVAPNLAEVVHNLIGVLHARLRPICAEAKTEHARHKHDGNLFKGRTLSTGDAGEPIGRRALGTEGYDVIVVKTEEGKARLIQRGGEKSVVPGSRIGFVLRR